MNYKQVTLLEDSKVWGKEIGRVCGRACRKRGIAFVNLERDGMKEKDLTERILTSLKIGE
jgi:hypothetical protein